MRLRAATNSDAAATQGVVFSVLREYGLQPDPDGTDSDLNDIDANYHHNGGFFAVGEIQDTIVASVGIYRVDRTTCEIRKMYLLAKYRGQGFGKQLLEFALSKARELGFQRVILETASSLVQAIALYRQYGFTPYACDHLAKRCDQAFELRL